jgi:hypothetical protein
MKIGMKVVTIINNKEEFGIIKYFGKLINDDKSKFLYK